MTPDDPRFNSDATPWPAWVTGFRDTQVAAMIQVVEAFNHGADVVMLDAPTGTGKTLLAEMVRRAGGFRNALYVCNTIGLQDQFLSDFPYAQLIKGRSNYIPLDGPPDATCADCSGKECTWCETPDGDVACPYKQARTRALQSQLSVTNTAYFIAEANHVGGFSGRDLVIADESDTLEGILTGYIEFRVPQKWLNRLGLDEPKKGSHGTTVTRWVSEVLTPALREWKCPLDDPLEKAAEARQGHAARGVRSIRRATSRSGCDNDAGPSCIARSAAPHGARAAVGPRPEVAVHVGVNHLDPRAGSNLGAMGLRSRRSTSDDLPVETDPSTSRPSPT